MPNESAIIVGAGNISNAWLPPLKAENINILAVVDLNIDAAKAVIAKHNLTAQPATDLAATLATSKPDFLVDLTIPDAHCTITTTALAAGIPVIGEKPMAATMKQARQMVATATKHNTLYMVSQSRRWDPKHHVIRKTIDNDNLGQLTTLNCDFYIGAHFGGFRDTMDSPLILDMAIHHFDLARYFCQADPVAVYAHEFNPEGSWYAGHAATTCIFEMANNIVFTYRGSWAAEGCHTSWNGNWRIVGQQGTLIYENDNDPTGQIIDHPTADFNQPLRDLPIPTPTLEYPTMHGALREMLDYLRTGQRPQTECHDNIKSLAMVFAAIESSRNQKRIPVEWT